MALNMSTKVTVRRADARGRVILPKHFAGKQVTVEHVNERVVIVRLVVIPEDGLRNARERA